MLVMFQDAHNCIPVFDEKTNSSFFAVYDGHGGKFTVFVLGRKKKRVREPCAHTISYQRYCFFYFLTS